MVEKILPETEKLKKFMEGCKFDGILLTKTNGEKRIYFFCTDKKLLIKSDKFDIFAIPERTTLIELTGEIAKEKLPIKTEKIEIK